MSVEEQIINEVCLHPVIYDKMFPGFKNNEIKNKTWNIIAQRIFNDVDTDTVEKLKQRWKALRDSYVKIMNKNKRKLRHGYTNKVPYKYEKQMLFIAPYVKMRNTLNKMLDAESDAEVLTGSENEYSQINDSGDPPAETKTEVSFGENFCEPIKIIKKTKLGAQKRTKLKKRKKKLVEAVSIVPTVAVVSENPVLPVMHQRPLVSTSRAELDDFFHSLAQTVKKLSPLTMARVKKDVANIVMDAEIEDLRRSTLHSCDPLSVDTSASNSPHTILQPKQEPLTMAQVKKDAANIVMDAEIEDLRCSTLHSDDPLSVDNSASNSPHTLLQPKQEPSSYYFAFESVSQL